MQAMVASISISGNYSNLLFIVVLGGKVAGGGTVG